MRHDYHEVPEIYGRIHLRDFEVRIVCRTCSDCGCNEVRGALSLPASEIIEGSAEGSHEIGKTLALGRIGRVFEINVAAKKNEWRRVNVKIRERTCRRNRNLRSTEQR